jgi:hypothetical protein
MKDGQRVVTEEPLKCVEDRNDWSPAMKFEVYPNRDSTVFMKRFEMSEAETFVRGTIRYTGFSAVSLTPNLNSAFTRLFQLSTMLDSLRTTSFLKMSLT